ncbi:MAG: ribosome maturation factor RimM [Andreesenia angusta]|nr:ribosome maturation factor RimM [Andreesenia angusta]
MEYIQIGKISSIHGVKGELKVIPLTDDIRRYDDLKEVYIGIDKNLIEIEKVSYLKNQIIIKFKDIDNISDAEKYLNNFLWIDIENANKPKDAYFLFEIIGLEVYDLEDNYIGKVRDIIQTGRNDLYLVKNYEKESLIPAVSQFIKEIDLDNKRIIIDPIEGLIDED